jgi:2,5-dihydroxypyridine 5,6-dioxygenase
VHLFGLGLDHALVAAFSEVLRRCGVQAGDACCVLAETHSRPVLVEAAQLALRQLGARAATLTVASPSPDAAPVPIRSTGASHALAGLEPVVQALAASALVVDCTVEGLQHAAELPRILKGGARVLVVSNEHPEILMRCLPRAEDEAVARDAMRRLKAARRMSVHSSAGTDLEVGLEGARVAGVWGFTSKPGTLTHWPAGLVLAFPAAGSVRGTLVLDRGDVNLTFKTYLRDAVRLSIEDDHVVAIDGVPVHETPGFARPAEADENLRRARRDADAAADRGCGDSVDAQTMRGYFAAWGDRSAYAVSHVGWGLNRAARWDAMNFYDKADFNGTELRAFAGNFLYSTGANEVAGRHTLGHFDLPMRGCTVALDGEVVVDAGRLP